MPQLPPFQSILDEIINALARLKEPAILVLDDYHTITNSLIHEMLEYFLEHQPRQAHLVIITRSDPPLPIARLRARRQMLEIRASDLRFTSQEAAALLGQVLRRDIDSATATEWTERTEGWVTGLLLMALSLRHRAETDDVSIGVPEGSPYLQDFLLAEVLAHLPPVKRNWLLLTSLLDRFCAPLCKAIGRPEAATDPVTRAIVLRQLDQMPAESAAPPTPTRAQPAMPSAPMGSSTGSISGSSRGSSSGSGAGGVTGASKSSMT